MVPAESDAFAKLRSIVIAIIGILAAIAIPNYISYRDKAFCSGAESDAQAIASGLSDYFSIPANRTFHGAAGNSVAFPGGSTLMLSRNNTTAALAPNATGQYRISVTDVSGRCPATYRAGNSRWAGSVYSLTL